MSGRFVRASSYRHVHGKTPKPDQEYSELKPQCTGEGNFIAANEKFFCYSGIVRQPSHANTAAAALNLVVCQHRLSTQSSTASDSV